MHRPPRILIFDSGLGGLTVYAEIARQIPGATLVYAADNAAFPYGDMTEGALICRVLAVVERFKALSAPDAIVIACNTASTLALPRLRARYPEIPFVGTVPAIKPAANRSRSGLISVLATPGTAARDYTRDLVRTYAPHCEVTLAGSSILAPIAEDWMAGRQVCDAAIAREIAPAFVISATKRTDCIVLACTHYPLLLSHFERLAPWPVDWIDPAAAIARRTAYVLREQLGLALSGGEQGAPNFAIFTGPGLDGRLAAVFRSRGIKELVFEPFPFKELAQQAREAGCPANQA